MARIRILITQEAETRGLWVEDSLSCIRQPYLSTPQKENWPGCLCFPWVVQHMQCTYISSLTFALLQREVALFLILSLGPLIDFSHSWSFYSWGLSWIQLNCLKKCWLLFGFAFYFLCLLINLLKMVRTLIVLGLIISHCQNKVLLSVIPNVPRVLSFLVWRVGQHLSGPVQISHTPPSSPLLAIFLTWHHLSEADPDARCLPENSRRPCPRLNDSLGWLLLV